MVSTKTKDANGLSEGALVGAPARGPDSGARAHRAPTSRIICSGPGTLRRPGRMSTQVREYCLGVASRRVRGPQDDSLTKCCVCRCCSGAAAAALPALEPMLRLRGGQATFRTGLDVAVARGKMPADSRACGVPPKSVACVEMAAEGF